MQVVVRFIFGGLVVSLFAALGDAVKPKSFAGLFAAAPSVALATLCLAIVENRKSYAALEARSMMAGGAAFFVYAAVVVFLIVRYKLHAGTAAGSALAVWMACAVGAWYFMLR